MFGPISTSRLGFPTMVLTIVAILSAGANVPLVHPTSGYLLGNGPGASGPTITENTIRECSAVGVSVDEGFGEVARNVGPSLTFGVNATVPISPVTSAPVDVAVDSTNGNVYVTDSGANNVSVINASTEEVSATIGVGPSPSGVVFDSMNSDVYVADFLGNDVDVISTATNTVVKTIPIPGGPVGLAYDSVSGDVYVTDQGANATIVISGVSVIKTVPVGGYPIAAAFDAENDNVYVANAGTANVSILNTTADNTVTGSIPVGTDPLGIAVDYGNGDLYVTNELSNNTTVIKTATEKAVTSIAVGPSPVGVAINPALSVVVIADEGDSQVNIVSDTTNALIQNVTVGQFPVGLTYDPINGYVYVADSNSSDISVIGTAAPPPYSISFAESGLPFGTNWSVTLEGTFAASKSGIITFSEPNSTYSFTVSAVAGYNVSPTRGMVVVDGFPISIAVTFSAIVYTVTFQESGLALVNETLWSVILNGTPEASNTTSLTFQLANGTYPYSVIAVAGYSANPSSGNVTVTGAPTTVLVTFGPSVSSSASGIPLWFYGVIAAVVLAVIFGILLLLRRRKPPTPTSPISPSERTPSQ